VALAKNKVEIMNTEKIISFINSERYIQAYELILIALEANPNDLVILDLSKVLSVRIRSRCVGLASNKETEMSLELFETEALYRIINNLHGVSRY
jgi:hypothetical protein